MNSVKVIKSSQLLLYRDILIVFDICDSTEMQNDAILNMVVHLVTTGL